MLKKQLNTFIFISKCLDNYYSLCNAPLVTIGVSGTLEMADFVFVFVLVSTLVDFPTSGGQSVWIVQRCKGNKRMFT